MKHEMPLDHAKDIANKVLNLLEPYCQVIYVCGSIRRREPMVGDIDIVMFQPFVEGLRELPWVNVAKKTAKANVRGLQVEMLFITELRNLGAAILHATGPVEFNIGLRKIAKMSGYKLNQYGLWDRDTGAYVVGETEEDVLCELGFGGVSPEKRGETWIAVEKKRELGL